jgi:mycobactin lysine-N-oxygenase
MSREVDLIVLGAGAKGAAIAMKAHVLNTLGLGPVTVTVVEAAGPAAAWRHGDGVSSSREILGLGPLKDVGFPYQGVRAFGAAGAAVDEAALSFSWQRYLVQEGRYAQWIDAGSPAVQRHVFGAYLAWVLARATEGVSVVRGRVTALSLEDGAERWVVDVDGSAGAARFRCKAFTLTGQGAQRTLSHDPQAAPRVLDCDSGRLHLARVASKEASDIAIVGAGESALSYIEFVHALAPHARLTIYTPQLPMSRVESFLENRVFSRPDEVGWTSLSEIARRDFVTRSDRGVFGADRVAAFGYDDRLTLIARRVTHVASAHDGLKVSVAYDSPSRAINTEYDYVINAEYDYVINCTGYDPLEQLRLLLTPSAQAEIERQAGPLWGKSCDEVSIGRSLALQNVHPPVHIPGLAALSQGPGFSTLGALGLLADRILTPFLVDNQDAQARSRRSSITEPV